MPLPFYITFFLLLPLMGVSQSGEIPVFLSPSGQVSVQLTVDEGRLFFHHVYRGDTLIHSSPLGLLVEGHDFSRGITVREVSSADVDETWQTINGKFPKVRNHYRQYAIALSKAGAEDYAYTIVFRLYDDGFAYRYQVNKSDAADSLRIDREVTELRFGKDFTYWAYNGEWPNVGPVQRSVASYDTVMTPMVIETAAGAYLAVHEAAVLEYAPFDLTTSGDNYSVTYRPVPAQDTGLVQTSWRAFLLGERPGDLVESNLLVNLNEPSKIADPSWIKPGKSLWDWRVAGYQTDDGFVYGLNTESHKRMIDFASENNVQYLLIDADWYGAEFSDTSDPTTARAGIDIEEDMAYAKEKGVGLILYLNDVGAKRFGLERVLRQFSEWEAVGVKYGFMKGDDQQKVAQTRRVVELCAKYKLMVNFHDQPIKPSGDERTWPNLVTKEYCHAQADGRRSYFPETMVSSAFINMIAGPLDYTNGWFDLNGAHAREKVWEEIPGTVAAEVAKLIVVYTGWMILPDSPEAYHRKDDLFECIRQMPGQFDSFAVLAGDIDEYITVARRAGDNWFVGSLTTREPRTLTLDFGFLPEGKKYRATLYEDTEETHYLNNKESYQIRTQEVDSHTQLEVQLAPGGGHAIHLKPI